MALYRFPRIIDFGMGVVSKVADHVRDLGGSHPLLVSDAGIRSAGILDRVESALREADLPFSLFDRVNANPSEHDVNLALAAYAEGECDSVVALGGGSVMDAAKLLRVLVRHGGDIVEYRSDAGGWSKIGADLPPMVAIPTTAGTGSEVTLGAVLTDASRNVKVWVGSPGLFPDVALVDPGLTVGSPAAVTASAGVDVLVHGVEAYSETSEAPLADLLARDAVELTVRNLLRAKEDPHDPVPREAMSRAAFQAGLAFGWKGLGAAHALGHQVTTEAGVPHGFAVAMLLPHVMRFNLPVAGIRYAELAPSLDVDGRADGSAEAAIQGVERLNGVLGVPRRLSDVGIGRERLSPMVAQALEDGTLPTNPRPCTEGEVMDLYREAF